MPHPFQIHYYQTHCSPTLITLLFFPDYIIWQNKDQASMVVMKNIIHNIKNGLRLYFYCLSVQMYIDVSGMGWSAICVSDIILVILTFYVVQIVSIYFPYT